VLAALGAQADIAPRPPVDAVLYGLVVRVRRQADARLALLDPEDGLVIATTVVPLHRGTSAPRAVWARELAGLLARLPPPGTPGVARAGASGAATPTDGDEEAVGLTRRDEQAIRSRAGVRATESESVNGSRSVRGEAGSLRTEAFPPEPEAEAPALHLGAGMGFESRSFDAAGRGSQPSYRSSLYSTVVIDAVIYPLRPLTRGALAGIGLYGMFDRSLGLKTRIPNMNPIDTTSEQLDLGLLYRLHFGGSRGLTLLPQVLYGYQSFDMAARTAMPNTEYQYLGAGLGLDLPLFGWPVALVASGAFDSLRSLGSTGAFGARYSNAWGTSLEAGLRLDLSHHASVNARFTDARRHAEFSGSSPIGINSTQTDDEWMGGRVSASLEF
jgi:hypothetical protein